MSTWYEDPRPAETKLLAQVIARCHPHLAKADVVVRLVRACRDDGRAPLHAGGAECTATIRRMSAAMRLLTKADALLAIDAMAWETLSDAERTSVLDHELTHVTLDEDAQGRVKQHRDRHPKLKMRNHDWLIAGFHEVVRRNGGAAIEAKAIRGLVAANQQLLEFMGTGPAQTEKPRSAAGAGHK